MRALCLDMKGRSEDCSFLSCVYCSSSSLSWVDSSSRRAVGCLRRAIISRDSNSNAA